MATTSLTLYGIRTCDTVKKARAWLDGQGVTYRFQDVREERLTAERLAGWISAIGEDRVLNRSSTTFRSLSETDRQSATGSRLPALILEHPTLMRRPILEGGSRLLAGFKPTEWADVLSSKDRD
jgi:Spx/MgsR family transcriptional regulator